MLQINAGATGDTVKVYFRSETGALREPLSATYSIWCETTGQEQRAPGVLSTSGGVGTVVLQAGDTDILGSGNIIETKRICVTEASGRKAAVRFQVVDVVCGG